MSPKYISLALIFNIIIFGNLFAQREHFDIVKCHSSRMAINNDNNSNNIEKIISYVKPNPATGETEIYYQSDVKGNAELRIYDIMGRELINIGKQISEGMNMWSFDANKLVNGNYIYRITIDGREVYSSNFNVLH